MTPQADVTDWLRLCHTRGIGSATVRKLLSAFGLPAEIFSADPAALRQLLSAREIAALLAPPDQDGIARALDWLAAPGNALLTLADPAYPPALLNIADPPPLLYVKGRSELLAAPALAVVGSRNATIQGMQNAEQFSAALSEAGFCVVSGMALGIDTAAHTGGLRGCASSVAVIGTGADVVYPARNHALAHMLAERGCIVSEYPLGTSAVASNFPRRNRIISGLARGVLVIEAAARSGSLITARLAAEQGREVFAIPGSIHAPLSRGCHLLIKQGAKLVECADDILEELSGWRQLPLAAAAMPEDPDPLLAQLGFDPAALDALAARCQLEPAALAAQLLALEMAGRIEVLPGGLVRRIA